MGSHNSFFTAMSRQQFETTYRFYSGALLNVILAVSLFFAPASLRFSTLDESPHTMLWGAIILLVVLLEAVGLLFKLSFVYRRQETSSFPWWSMFLFIGHFMVTTLLLLLAMELLGLFSYAWLPLVIIIGNIIKEIAVFVIPSSMNPRYWWTEIVGDGLLTLFIILSFVVLWQDLAYDPKMRYATYGVDALARYFILFFLIYFPIRIAYTLEERLVANTWKEKISLWISTMILLFSGLHIVL